MAILSSNPINEFKAGAGFFTSQHLVARYQLFRAFNRYVYNSGKTMMPVAAAAPAEGLPSIAARVVQLAQPFGFRIYSWAVEREGAKPLLPHPAPQNPDNEIFLEGTVTTQPPDVDASASVHTYFVEGVYVYGLLVPILNGTRYVSGVGAFIDLLRMGGAFYDSTAPDDNVYSPDDFAVVQ